MNTMQKVRESVQKYLSEIPKDVLQQKLDRFNKMDFEGISRSEYLQSLEPFNAQLNNAPIIQLRMAQFREPLWNQMPTKVAVSTLLLLNRSNPITKPHFNHIKNLALAA